MHNATIPLAALTTFALVYWLTPAPAAAPQAEPVPAVESQPAVEAPGGVPSARRISATPVRSRGARTRRTVVARLHDVPVHRARAVSVYFPGCNEVRAAGLAPLYRGQPGYRPEMDGDDDGIACEPHHGRRRW
jgi:hypothetical protein